MGKATMVGATAQPQVTSLTAAGRPTQAWVAGQGPGVLLLHGSADSPQAWHAVMARLSDRYRLWAPALPPVTEGLAIDQDLPWLDDLLAQTGARVLAAHSYGALLALRFALSQSKGPAARLDRLVLAEPIAWGIAQPEVDERLAELRRLSLDQFDAGNYDEAMRWLVDFWNGAGFWGRLPDKVRAGLLAGAARTHAEVASGRADRTHAAELLGLQVPTRLLAGALSPPESVLVSRRLAAGIPGASLTLLAGAGHQFLRSHAAEVAAAIADEAAGTSG